MKRLRRELTFMVRRLTNGGPGTRSRRHGNRRRDRRRREINIHHRGEMAAIIVVDGHVWTREQQVNTRRQRSMSVRNNSSLDFSGQIGHEFDYALFI